MGCWLYCSSSPCRAASPRRDFTGRRRRAASAHGNGKFIKGSRRCILVGLVHRLGHCPAFASHRNSHPPEPLPATISSAARDARYTQSWAQRQVCPGARTRRPPKRGGGGLPRLASPAHPSLTHTAQWQAATRVYVFALVHRLCTHVLCCDRSTAGAAAGRVTGLLPHQLACLLCRQQAERPANRG